MKNLFHVDLDYFGWYQEIVKSKNNNQELLNPDFLKAVKERYDEYITNFSSSSLIQVKDSEYEKNHQLLTGCYKSKTKKVQELLSKIKNNQSDVAKSKCQYCGIGKPGTIDHYLPISTYPEFAVLAINLLPCCAECNKKKDNYWKEEGVRGILNFYLDNIPEKQFLNGKVTFRNDVPSISFELDLTGLENTVATLITSHFKRLELLDRYKEESSDEISEIVRQLNIYAKDKVSDDIKKLLLEDSDDLKNNFGMNYWKAVLRESLAESKSFLEDV